MNPFSDSYCRKEISKLNCPEIKSGHVTVRKVKIIGRCDNFLNVNFRGTSNAIDDCPIFYKGGSIWMSLTPMEIQSHYLPIKHGRANANISTVGLGIGYFTVMVMSSPKVKTFDVYEIDPEVISVFKKNFSDRKGFSKLNFIVGDYKNTFKKKVYDFCYVDHYQALLPDCLVDDYRSLKKDNSIKLLRPWGIELCFLDSSAPEDIADFLNMNDSNLKHLYVPERYKNKVKRLISKHEKF